MKLKTNVISAQKALDQLKIESVEKTSKIEALKMTKFRWNAELASTQDALEETRVECVENRSEIQALRIAKIKLETEVTSAQKALEESKAESKVELKKVENQLQTEVASKKCLEESLAKYQKLKQLLATKIFQSNPSNEDLIALLNLEIEKLFEKYEQIIRFNKSDSVKVEEGVDCTVKDKKLDLQILQRELYEKELDGIMDVLKMPSGDRNYTRILPMIKDLLQQVDTDHFSNVVENLINMNNWFLKICNLKHHLNHLHILCTKFKMWDYSKI